MVGGIEKWKDKRVQTICVFSWKDKKVKRDEKFICLAKKKNERIENEISINLQLCPH